MDISELRVVIIHWATSAYSVREYIVHKDEVDKFVQAQKELHIAPGINPYNGETTVKIRMISVAKIRLAGPYWWTTPGLGKGPNVQGAFLYQAGEIENVYMDNEWNDEMS